MKLLLCFKITEQTKIIKCNHSASFYSLKLFLSNLTLGQHNLSIVLHQVKAHGKLHLIGLVNVASGSIGNRIARSGPHHHRCTRQGPGRHTVQHYTGNAGFLRQAGYSDQPHCQNC